MSAAPQSEHMRVLGSGAFWVLLPIIAGLCWIDTKVPDWLGCLITWAVFISISYGIAVYKRRKLGWLCFWGMVALAVVSLALHLAGLSNRDMVVAGLIAGCGLDVAYYWLVRMPKWRPAVEVVTRHETHIFHHLVGHRDPATVTATAPGARLPAPVQKVISGKAVQAITAPHRALTARLGASVPERAKVTK